jgi:Tfp pilus assembly PilM family ATPase
MKEAMMFGSKSLNRTAAWMSGSGTSLAADFGRSTLRLLQLSGGARGYECRAAAEVAGTPLEDTTAVAAPPTVIGRTAADELRALPFSGTSAAVTLPAELFQSDIARMPAMPDGELAESIRFEAMDRFSVSAESSCIGHVRLGATAGGSIEVLMLSVARDAVDRATRTLSRAGLAPVRVEHAGLAALRALSRQRAAECTDPADARDWCMLHLEDRAATLAMVRDGNLSFFRTVRGDWSPSAGPAAPTHAGGMTTMLRLADEPIPLENTDAGPAGWRWCSLAEESLRCLRHFQRAASNWWPRAIVLTGPAAVDPQAAATVESVCGAPTSLAVPIRLLESPDACIHGNAWVAAIGAACAGLPALRPAGRSSTTASSPASRSTSKVAAA